MKLTIVIDLDNDAFQPGPGCLPGWKKDRDDEIARILIDLAFRFHYGPSGESSHGYEIEPDGGVHIRLRDTNGNTVGHATIR